ncbi:MAG: ABC transporter ATP-binding protein [Anaerolineae bacterium]
MAEQNSHILGVRDLKVYYWTARGPVQAVDEVTFDVRRNEILGLVGESGCGKSTTAMALLRLIKAPGSIEGGQILLNDRDILSIGEEEMRRTRWAEISLIPQGAMNALNPVMRINDQIKDGITQHQGAWSGNELDDRIEELLRVVKLPGEVAGMYPHELSGGMKQRVCIAMAIALEPPLIIADEPTSALDVIVQRAVMETLTEVQQRMKSSLILIGHDMGLQAQVVDRMTVMYAGKIAEIGDVEAMFADPLHPYTELLIASLPSPTEKKTRKAIPGLPPTLLNPPSGCRFNPRCPYVMDVCRDEVPPLVEVEPDRWVACHLRY